MAYEAAQDIVREFCNVSDAELSNANINWLHLEIANRFTELESELAALRQVVADVETCIAGGSLKVFPKAEYEPKEIQFAVAVRTDCESGPALYCAKHAPTWQAALHAAAEHVRQAKEQGE